MDSDILSQLVQIKWLFATLVAIVLLSTSVRVWVGVRRGGGLQRVMRDNFVEEALSLLEQNRNSELLNLSLTRSKELPGDAYAYWYHAMAAYRLGDVETALNSMRKTGELQPEWRESHVEPFVRALTQQGSQ